MDAERARRSLSEFIRQAWGVLEPGTQLEWNWHVDVIADHVQALFEDWIAVQKARQEQTLDSEVCDLEESRVVQRAQNLVINVPPGTAKSRIVAVMAPAWMWLLFPGWRVICLSANPRVSLRDSVYCRTLIESEWYQQTFKPTWKMARDQNAKSLFRNTEGGFRQALGFNAKITGDRADAIIWDDPHDAKDVKSDAKRLSVLEKYDDSIGNRVNDLRSSLRLGIMQRLNELDLTGHVILQGDYRHLCLPMEKEAKPVCKCKDCTSGETFLGWKDTRKEGEVLHPRRFTQKVLAAERRRLGSTGYAGQMQQRPAPKDGIILLRSHWKYYTAAPDAFDEVIQSWDMAFKKTADSSFVVGQVWGRKGAKRYLLDQVRRRMGFSATCAAVVSLSKKWPQARRKLVEAKANGPAVMDALSNTVSGLTAVETGSESKEARAWAAQPEQEAGNYYLPAMSAPEDGPPVLEAWVEEFIDECAAFPNGAANDQVDTFSQAGAYFARPLTVVNLPEWD